MVQNFFIVASFATATTATATTTIFNSPRRSKAADLLLLSTQGANNRPLVAGQLGHDGDVGKDQHGAGEDKGDQQVGDQVEAAVGAVRGQTVVAALGQGDIG